MWRLVVVALVVVQPACNLGHGQQWSISLVLVAVVIMQLDDDITGEEVVRHGTVRSDTDHRRTTNRVLDPQTESTRWQGDRARDDDDTAVRHCGG
jgi:hypothetical protein